MVFNYKKNKLEQLKGFCAVVENKNSINDAAAKSNISATTISKQISSLEQDLGFILFNRVKNRLILNQNGKKYYKEAKKVLLDLDKIYNGKIGVNKFSTKEILKNKLQKIFLRIKQFLLRNISRMIIKVRFKSFCRFIIILSLICLFSYETKVQKDFKRRSIEVSTNVSKTILHLESQMGKILENASAAFAMYLENNKNPTMFEIQAFCAKFNVDNCGIQDRNGIVILSSRKDANKPENKAYYAKNSIKNRIRNFDEILKKQSVVLLSSFYGINSDASDKYEQPIVKGIDRWEKSLNRILYMKIRSKSIMPMLKEYIAENSNFEKISIIASSGKILASTGIISNSMVNPIERYMKYPVVQTNKNIITVSLSFGGYQDKKIEEELNNSNDEYFYNLQTTFTTTSLKRHLWTVRIVTILSLSTFLSLIYIWNKTRIEKIERSKKRRNGRWG